ncbi:MAG TPA: hypothetical protein VFE91_02820, partial [Nitrososphaerales archaeon]|nr:hypothetical protein [Nitrososphaerales archaeon]
GVVVLIIGFAIAGFGLTTPVTTTTTTTGTTTQALVRSTQRTVLANGFWAMGAANLQPGEVVTGSVSVSNYSAAKGPVYVYVQNESSFIAWGGCAPCGGTNELNKSLPSSGSYSFTWTAPKGGSYFFVLDSDYYGAAAPASFQATGVASGTSSSTSTAPNTTLNYGGFGVAVLGAIILAAGLVMGAPAPKKQNA